MSRGSGLSPVMYIEVFSLSWNYTGTNCNLEVDSVVRHGEVGSSWCAFRKENKGSVVIIKRERGYENMFCGGVGEGVP